MDRRNFFKTAATASGAALTGACSDQATELLPMLIPETEIPLGVEERRPSVCRECSAGCGTEVRVMAAERQVLRDGQTYRQHVAAIKKIEGNAADPVSGGRLCARGQAAVQRLYHPMRFRNPKRRGDSAPTDATWDEALALVQEKLAATDPAKVRFASKPGVSLRGLNIARFLEALGAPPATTLGVDDFAVEREAAKRVFGWDGLPVYDLQEADYALSIGADFLGGWVSPVFYARRFGHFRQGRETVRGMLVHAESRHSQTAWSADRWLALKPGLELELALAIGKLLIERGAAVSDALAARFAVGDPAATAAACGFGVERLEQTADGLVAARNPVVIAGASIVNANSTEAVSAALALNELLGAVGREGGVFPPVETPEALAGVRPESGADISDAEVLFVDGVNVPHLSPESMDVLERAFVVSFHSTPDNLTFGADVVLPAHDALESADAVWSETAPGPAIAGADAFVKPLYETRALEETLAAIAEGAGKTFEPVKLSDLLSRDERRAGGRWSRREAEDTGAPASLPDSDATETSPEDGYPVLFQTYLSPLTGDGSARELPWLQEAPDPTSSAMWSQPLEIDPGTARELGVANGDAVRVVSAHGELTAPAYVHPAAVPGVASLALGVRLASPLRLTSGADAATGARVMTGPVRLEKGEGGERLIQQSTVDREHRLVRIGDSHG